MGKSESVRNENVALRNECDGTPGGRGEGGSKDEYACRWIRLRIVETNFEWRGRASYSPEKAQHARGWPQVVQIHGPGRLCAHPILCAAPHGLDAAEGAIYSAPSHPGPGRSMHKLSLTRTLSHSHTLTHTLTHTHAHTHTHACTHARTLTHTCTHAHVCNPTQSHMHLQHRHTNSHTHKHRRTLDQVGGRAWSADALKVAVQKWNIEYAASKAAEERRRAPDWDLETLVGLSRKSPSLQLCKDLDSHMLVLMRELSCLSVWRKEAFEQRLLPLQHFTHLSVVCSRLARAKGNVESLLSLLVSQVRALFVESSDERALLLHKELLLRRDNQSTAQQEVERMYDVNDYLRKELASSRACLGWVRMVLTHEIQSLEKAARMYYRDSKTYIEKVKERTNIQKILTMTASDLGVEDDGLESSGGGRKPSGKLAEIAKRQQLLLKHASGKVTTHEEQVKLREGKLIHQQEKYREAVQEYETGVQDLQRKTAITEAKSLEVEALKKRLDDDQVRMEGVVKAANKELAELQRAVEEKFQVLGSLETDLSHQAHAIEAAAREQLMSLSKHAAADVSEQSQKALIFAYESSAYIKNTKVYPGETDWAKKVRESVGSPLNSPKGAVNGQGTDAELETPSSPVSSYLDSTMGASGRIVGKGRQDVPLTGWAADNPAALKNPTIEAFVEYVETLDDDEQDELRVAITERRFQVHGGKSVDEQIEKRLAVIKQKEDNFRERELKCQVLEDGRKALEQHVNRMQRELQALTTHSKVSPDKEQQMVAAQQAYRTIELDLQEENVKLQSMFLLDKLTGTDAEKEILKQVMASSATNTQIGALAKEREAVIARQDALNEAQKLFETVQREVEQKEAVTKDLEKQVQEALEKATVEQKAFELSSCSRMQMLEDKEKTVKAKLTELRAYEGDESKIEAILELKKTISDKDKLVREKEKVIAKLEKELQESASRVRDTVDALVDKATESLVKEMTKKEDKIEKREELVSAQSSRVEAEMAKIQDLSRAEKALKDAENKMKRANEQLAINNKREEELLALAKQLDREREAVRKGGASEGKDGDVDGMATAFDHRIRGLNQHIKDLKANEKVLNAKIQKLEASSRRASTGATPHGATPQEQSRLPTAATADATEIDAWNSRYLDPANPSKEEVRHEAARLQDLNSVLEARSVKMKTDQVQLQSHYDLQMAELKLRQESLDQQQSENDRQREAMSAITSKIEGLENMSQEQIESLREKLKDEMKEMLTEYQSAKAQDDARRQALQLQIDEAEEKYARRSMALRSKTKILDYVQEADELSQVPLVHSAFVDHAKHLQSLISSPHLDISHLLALQVPLSPSRFTCPLCFTPPHRAS